VSGVGVRGDGSCAWPCEEAGPGDLEMGAAGVGHLLVACYG